MKCSFCSYKHDGRLAHINIDNNEYVYICESYAYKFAYISCDHIQNCDDCSEMEEFCREFFNKVLDAINKK